MIDFIRYKWLYFLISAMVILPGVFSLVKWGLKPSIDFTGGTIWEIATAENTEKSTENAEIKKGDWQKILEEKQVEVISIEEKPEEHFILRLKAIDDAKKEELTSAFRDNLKDFTEIRYELVGPTLGRELLVKTITGVVLAAFLILLYVAYRFKDKMYGICAILAMFHDTLVLLGSFSLLGHFFNVEVDTLYVTAVLTILSFSVHDTIVVYDRIRESIKKNLPVSGGDFTFLVNKAINETLTRSINNSLTIIFMLLALVILGGVTIRWFAAALLIGIITGTYSSTFTATPLLVLWHELKSRKR
ncbi:MAG: protein translocase subunit SecF [Candidatus Cloacimonetes bacterium]|nr:protein translocase subunit SecF [Candidatus Cloacimonadota bacterium]